MSHNRRLIGAIAGALAVTLMAGGCAGRAPAASPRIAVDKPIALVDEAIRIRITDLPPAQQVDVSADLGADGHHWRSQASFRADRKGVIDLQRARPLGGTYTKADGMGLFWSMASARGAHWVPVRRSYPVTITVSGEDGVLARRRVTRVLVGHGVRHRALTVAKDKVAGSLYLPPEGSAKAAPVLVIGGSEGGDAMRDVAALLASHGHPTLSVCYFGCAGRPGKLQGIPLEYFVSAARLLARQPTADAEKMVVMGGSRGSEAAQLLGQDYPGVFESVVAWAASNRAGPAYPDTLEYAWTKDGKPIPESQIPLDHVRGTVLGIVGGDDHIWAASLLAEPIADGHRLLVYPKAGHDVTGPPYLPTPRPGHGETPDFGGTQATNADAKVRSWPKVLRLLRD